MGESLVYILLIRLGVMASLASILSRSDHFKRMLLREERTLVQRLRLAAILAIIFAAGVSARIITGSYEAVDFALEASFLSGFIGGYVPGLVAGGMLMLPGLLGGEWLSLPLFVGAGALGGLLRNLAPEPDEIWRFSPLAVLGARQALRDWRARMRILFHLATLVAVVWLELLRQGLGRLFGKKAIFYLSANAPETPVWHVLAIYVTTVFVITIPLKIWGSVRNEQKLEEQNRLLVQARLQALSSQINPHFLFNTLNSVHSLIRTDPELAREVVVKLSRILRNLLAKHETFVPLSEELKFIEDYLDIEKVRFGERLQVVKDIDPEAESKLVPSMILQPLVENAIKHGLSKKLSKGTLKLEAKLKSGHLILAVEDDGVGIPHEKQRKLTESGIGVRNVNERLQVLFGSSYRFRIHSEEGKGTRVELELPVVEGIEAATVG